jgi:hypothetical protein
MKSNEIKYNILKLFIKKNTHTHTPFGSGKKEKVSKERKKRKKRKKVASPFSSKSALSVLTECFV